MDAISRTSLSALAGAVLGLFTGLALIAAGALNPLNAILATFALAAFVVLLVPTTSSRPASGVGDRSGESHGSPLPELDSWLASRAAMGRSIQPTVDLTAEATRRFGRPIRREWLVAAWERFEARRSTRRMLGGAA